MLNNILQCTSLKFGLDVHKVISSKEFIIVFTSKRAGIFHSAGVSASATFSLLQWSRYHNWRIMKIETRIRKESKNYELEEVEVEVGDNKDRSRVLCWIIWSQGYNIPITLRAREGGSIPRSLLTLLLLIMQQPKKIQMLEFEICFIEYRSPQCRCRFDLTSQMFWELLEGSGIFWPVVTQEVQHRTTPLWVSSSNPIRSNPTVVFRLMDQMVE